MLILHAGEVNGRLTVWGEMTPQTTARSGRKSSAVAQSSPFDPGLAPLLQSLALAFGDARDFVVTSAQHIQPIYAWLPTAAGRPIPSSPLIEPGPTPPNTAGDDAAIRSWKVTGVSLTAPQTIVLLGACSGRDTLAPGIAVGSTLAWWAKGMRFAGAVVARQQFVPDIESTQEGYRAVWRPVFTGTAAEVAAKLAASMPSACRALSARTESAPDEPSSAILTRFLTGMTDSIVRSVAVRCDSAPAKPQRTRKLAGFDSVHAQWIAALQSGDGLMHGENSEFASFASQVREWQNPLTLSAAAPYQLCVRLEEPLFDETDLDTAEGEWFVRYLVRPVDDPSLLIPASDVWVPGSGGKSGARRDPALVRTHLLAALGRAAKISPQIEASLKTPNPEGYVLDTAGAQEFLTEQAWLLEQAGIVPLLPSWWTGKGTKQRLAARATVKAPPFKTAAGLSMETVVGLDWEVAIGGHSLTFAELEELARQKTGLVRLRGQWVQLDSSEIEAALARWRRNEGRKTTVRDVMRMALGAETGLDGVSVEKVQASGWIAELLREIQQRDSIKQIPVPPTIRASLRPYQERGYSWLAFLARWNLGACLADDMGLGKTLQTIAYIRRQWDEAERRPALVVCPTSVVGNWLREVQRFAPDLPVAVHHGAGRAKDQEFEREAAQQAVVLTSYALLHRDIEFLKEVDWSGVVLDEAQNIKNPETRQSKAARALNAEWKIALTGTPVENHVGDLWPIMDFLNPGLLGTRAEFRRAFFNPIQTNSDPSAVDRLKGITQPFILRRLKTDKSVISDLPDKLEMKVYCTLNAEQASLYRAVAKDAEDSLDEAEGIQRRGLVLAVITKLKQVCNHPAQFLGDNSAIPGRSGKLARLTEMLEEVVEAGDQALIFTQYSEMAEILRRHLQETFAKEALLLHGGVPKKQRDRMVERFQSEGAALPFFILSIKAGGVGLNLTAASHVFHFDRWWNPAVENQATDRAFRIGQTRKVQVHKFICAGTLEEKIDALIESKRQIAAGVVGTGEDWLTELSTQELKEIFALRQDALAGAE